MNRAPLYWIIVAALRIDSFIHVGSLSCFLMADKQVALPIDALACLALPASPLAAFAPVHLEHSVRCSLLCLIQFK